MATLINKPLEICLKLAGIWPYQYNWIGPLILVSIPITLLPFQCYNATNLTNDPVLLMDSLSDIVTEIVILLKFFIMWINSRNMKDLIIDIIENWNRKVVRNEWKILARYCSIFCHGDLIVYIFASIPYYFDLFTMLTKTAADRHMVLKSQYPFDCLVSPIYEIINITMLIQAAMMIIIDILSKSFLLASVLHVVSRINLLEYYIKEYSSYCNDNNSNRRRESLRCVIKEHLNILTLVQKINTAYRYVSFFQIVFSNVIICVTGYVILIAFKSANIFLLGKFILFIIAMLSQSFTFCFVGQYLRNKGESIIVFAYSCLWYNQPQEVKAIILLILRAQKPLTLSGGKIFELSIKTFVQILKTSFSYLTVLRAVYN